MQGCRDPGPRCSSTELPRGKGTTYHTVSRVRNWHRLHHQIRPCGLSRKTNTAHQRAPRGVAQEDTTGTSTQRRVPVQAFVSWTPCWCRRRRGPAGLAQLPAQERAAQGDSCPLAGLP